MVIECTETITMLHFLVLDRGYRADRGKMLACLKRRKEN